MTQDISGTVLAASRASGRGHLCRVFVQWDGTNWVDESAYVQSANGKLEAVNTDAGLSAIGNGIADEATIVLNNQTERFTPWYAAGPLYSYIGGRSWLGLAFRVLLGYYTGPSLIVNGDFETSTGGDFGTWVDTVGSGAIAVEGTSVHGGSAAAKLTAGATSNTTLHQAFTVVPGTFYSLTFYTRGDGLGNCGKYQIVDATHSTDIVAVTNTGVTGTNYAPLNVQFIAPTDCTSVRLVLGCPVANGGVAYYDDVTLVYSEGVYVMKGHIEDYAIDAVGREVTITARDKSQRMLEYRPKTTLLQNMRTDQIIEQYVNTLPATQRPTIAASTLVMDKGTYVIPFAWLDDEPLWSEMVKIAEAEGGRLYYSPSGAASVSSKLVFENATHALTIVNIEPIFTVDDYTELSGGVSPSRKEYKNAVEVWYYPLRIAQEQIIWSSAEQYRLPAGATKIIKASFDNPAYSVVDPVNDDYFKDFVFTTSGGAAKNESTDVTVSLYDGAERQVWAQQAYVKVINLLGTDLYLRKLELRGRPVITGKEQKVTLYRTDAGVVIEDPADSAPRAGWRMISIDNRNVQTREHAEALGRFLLDRYAANRLTKKVHVVKAMPWLEVGDRITTTAPGGLSASHYIQRLDWNYGERGFTMTLDLLPADDLYAYSDYFLLGTSVLGNVTGKGRAFY